MSHRSKPPRRLHNTFFAILALVSVTLSSVTPSRAQENNLPVPPATTSTSTTPTTLPATTGPNAHPIAATPAPEPINLGFNGAPDDPSKPVAVHIVSPKPEEVLNSSTVDIFLTVDNYTLAEGGNRLHVIVNNNEPIPVHDLRQPLTLKELPEGGHTIRVLAVQPDGHSLPNPEAYAMIHFYIRKKNFQNYAAPNAPYLTVNLPISGIVDVEDGGRVWFDFRTHNAPLAPNGYRVHYRINNVEGTISELKPVFWDGMKPGRYELFVELLDASGSPVLGVFNQIKRSFDVRAAVKALAVEAEAPAATTPAATPAPANTNATRSTNNGNSANNNNRRTTQQAAPRALPAESGD